MLKISYAGSLGRSSPAILAQFILKICATDNNCKKISKTLYFGGSRLFKVIDVSICRKLFSGACYDKLKSLPICNRFHVRQVDGGKQTTS